MSANVSISPVQVKQLLFTKVWIEPFEFEYEREIWAPTFDFFNTEIQTELMIAVKEGEEDDPRNFLVSLKVSLPNDAAEKDPAPYYLDIQAQALIELEPVFDVEKRGSIASVNGSAVVLGAIRELVTQLTARSVYGPMTLPTLRFDAEDQHRD